METKIHPYKIPVTWFCGQNVVSLWQKAGLPRASNFGDEKRGTFMAILVSGGAGYIGSHTCIELLNAGFDIVVADNYYNSCPEALKRVREITGKDFKFVEADMTDHAAVEKVFAETPGIDCVIKFAAYNAVGKSDSKPIE